MYAAEGCHFFRGIQKGMHLNTKQAPVQQFSMQLMVFALLWIYKIKKGCYKNEKNIVLVNLHLR